VVGVDFVEVYYEVDECCFVSIGGVYDGYGVIWFGD